MPARNIRDGSLTIEDATTPTANTVTVALEDGDLAWTERVPVNQINDRGVFDHFRKAPDEPVELSFSSIVQTLSGSGPDPYDAVRGRGDASAWSSVSTKSDNFATKMIFTITDPTGTNTETVTFAEVHVEEIAFSEGEPSTLEFSGRDAEIEPTLA